MLTTRKYLRSEIRPANDTSSSPHTHTHTHTTHTHTHTLQVNGNIPTWSQFTSSLPPDVFKVYIYFRVGGVEGGNQTFYCAKRQETMKHFKNWRCELFKKNTLKLFFCHPCGFIRVLLYIISPSWRKKKKKELEGESEFDRSVFSSSSLSGRQNCSPWTRREVCVCVCVCVWVSVSVCVHVCVLSFKEKGG